MQSCATRFIPTAIPGLTKNQSNGKVRSSKKDDDHEKGGGEEVIDINSECKELLASLSKEKGWRTPYLYKLQGFWCQPKEIQAILSYQKHFKSVEGDLILATIPKSGTTWLKALTFAIINRSNLFSENFVNHPLFNSNPHDLVPFFEYKLYANNQVPDLSNLPHPRLFATHIPFPSVNINGGTRIVYLCRNPFDTFISSWHYTNKIKPQCVAPLELEEAFEMYCKGVVGFGPFWEHMLGYWKESRERPDKVLFLKYEDMKENMVCQLKKLASFLGFPFTMEEEEEGVVEEIVKLCSFENLKRLEVNKSGKSIKNFENKHLFRKAEVGDWRNYFSPSMVKKLSQVMDENLGGSGLTFKLY